MSETVVTVVAHHPYEAQRDDELAFEKGDVIQVVNKSDPDWWVGKKDNGDSGFFPSNFVEIVNEKDAATDNEKPVDTNNQHQDADASETAQEEKEDEQEKAPANVPIGMARVMEDYAMQEPDELTLHRGGIVTLFERTDSWMRGELNGKTGRFPAKYVEDIDMPGRPDLGQGGPMYGQKEATEEGAARPAFRLASFGVKQGGIGSLLAGGFPTLKKTGSAGKVPTEKSEKHVVEPQPSSEDAAAASSELESRPSSVVSGQQKEEEKQSEAASATVLGKAMVLHPYDAENEDELTLLRGEYIQITNRHADEGWWEGVNEKGQRGIFPANFVKELEEEKAAPAPPVRSRKSVASVGSQQSMASPSLTGGFRLPPLPTSRPSSAASNVTAEKPPLPETPKQRAPPVTEESAVSEGSEGQSEEQSSAPASSYRVPSTNDEPAQVEETTGKICSASEAMEVRRPSDPLGPSLSEPKIEEKPATENVTEAAEVSAKTPEEAIKSPEEEFDTVTSATPLVDLNEHAVSAAEESQSVKPTEETKENDNVEDANKSIQASLEPVSEKKLPSEAPVPVPVPEQPAKPIETETAPVKESPKTSPIETSTNEKEPAEVATEVKPSTDEPEPEPAAAVKEAQTSEDEKKDNEPEAQAEKDKPEQREEAIPAITESNEASEEHPTSEGDLEKEAKTPEDETKKTLEALPSGPRLSAPSRARPGARPRRSPQGSPSGNSKHELSQMELLQQDLAQSPSEETPKESPVSDVSSEKSTSTSPPAKPVKPIFAKFPTPFAVNKDDIANKTLKPVQRRIWEPAPAHEPKEEKKSEQQEAPRPSGVKNIASRFNFGGVPSGGSNEVLETKLKNFSKNEVEKTRKEFQQLLEEERAQRLQLEELVKTLAAKIEHLESQLSQQ